MPTRPKVLTLNGLSLSDFKTHVEALKVADEIVELNKKEMGHNYAPQEHSNPLLVKVFYIHGEGKKVLQANGVQSFHSRGRCEKQETAPGCQ